MSWQSYVDTNLVGSGKVTKACILGQQGGVWATSPGFNLAPDEQAFILKAFDNPENTQANGIRLAGQKYFTLQATPNHVYGKHQANGCVLVKSKQAILVAVYETPIQQPETASVVEALGEYLTSVGY
ncbi:hypothetical protein ONZ45_g9385 [Pleurotus djamor]|nr:hypothetical protein ONZ45_g9385 [Pleurotus djamor]